MNLRARDDGFVLVLHLKKSDEREVDRATSGVVMAAKSLETVFRTRLAHKTYLALVMGQSRHRRGRIEDPLIQRRTPNGISRFVAVRDKKKLKALAGKIRAATTLYAVRKRFASTALMEVETESGRTHQIRAHLAPIGLPLAGDGDYGERLPNRKRARNSVYSGSSCTPHGWRFPTRTAASQWSSRRRCRMS